MFDISCILKSAVGNDPNGLAVQGIDYEKEKLPRGSVKISIGSSTIIVNGYDLQCAIDNCLNNGSYIRTHNSPYRDYDNF